MSASADELKDIVGNLLGAAATFEQKNRQSQEQKKQHLITLQKQKNNLRLETFKVLDMLQEMFQKAIEHFQESQQDMWESLALKANPLHPTVFVLHYRTLTLMFEVADIGEIRLSFGNPEKQHHSRFNWVLRGIINSQNENCNWYLFNMREQPRPDVRIQSLVEVVHFAIRELVLNYEVYSKTK